MGGHGALVLALRNPAAFKSVSAFAPICNPTQVPWGQKAFAGYLGDGWQVGRRGAGAGAGRAGGVGLWRHFRAGKDGQPLLLLRISQSCTAPQLPTGVWLMPVNNPPATAPPSLPWQEAAKAYDATELVRGYSGPQLPVLMDTGTDDEFLQTQVRRLGLGVGCCAEGGGGGCPCVLTGGKLDSSLSQLVTPRPRPRLWLPLPCAARSCTPGHLRRQPRASCS